MAFQTRSCSWLHNVNWTWNQTQSLVSRWTLAVQPMSLSCFFAKSGCRKSYKAVFGIQGSEEKKDLCSHQSEFLIFTFNDDSNLIQKETKRSEWPSLISLCSATLIIGQRALRGRKERENAAESNSLDRLLNSTDVNLIFKKGPGTIQWSSQELRLTCTWLFWAPREKS